MLEMNKIEVHPDNHAILISGYLCTTFVSSLCNGISFIFFNHCCACSVILGSHTILIIHMISQTITMILIDPFIIGLGVTQFA